MQLIVMKGAADAVATPSQCGMQIPYTQQSSRRRRRLQEVVNVRFEPYDFTGLATALKLSVNNIYGKKADSITYKRDDKLSDADVVVRDPLSWPVRVQVVQPAVTATATPTSIAKPTSDPKLNSTLNTSQAPSTLQVSASATVNHHIAGLQAIALGMLGVLVGFRRMQ